MNVAKQNYTPMIYHSKLIFDIRVSIVYTKCRFVNWKFDMILDDKDQNKKLLRNMHINTVLAVVVDVRKADVPVLS